MTAADLHNIVQACPKLNRVRICNVLEPHSDVSPLRQLSPSCQNLEVAGEAFGDAAAGVIAQLTQLTALRWSDAPCFSDTGLRRLTTLIQLQYLALFGVFSDGLSHDVAPREEEGGEELAAAHFRAQPSQVCAAGILRSRRGVCLHNHSLHTSGADTPAVRLHSGLLFC